MSGTLDDEYSSASSQGRDRVLSSRWRAVGHAHKRLGHLARGIADEGEPIAAAARSELVLVLVRREPPAGSHLPQPHEPVGVRADTDAAHQRDRRHPGQCQRGRLVAIHAPPSVELRLALADALPLSVATLGSEVRVGDNIFGEELAVERSPERVVLRSRGEFAADAGRRR